METLSVIVPAHNEEAHIGRCLESIRRAAQRIPNPVEIVVALNRCDDGTGDIARRYDALLVTEDARNLARIRNAGVRKSQGGIVVTIDADSWMSDNMLFEVTRRLARGRDVGGGVMVHFERMSAGMLFSLLTFAPKLLSEGLWAGLFWTKRSSFDAVGGFNEEMVSAEDVDFARRLKAYGARRGLR